MVLASLLDIMASTNISIPIPPIQWVKALQKRHDFDIDSTSLSIVAPVVVNPETVSKSASAKSGISPDMTNGTAPITDIIIHATATLTKPSIEKIELSLGFFIVKANEIIMIIANGIPNDETTCSSL